MSERQFNIICGDALTELRGMASESVNCCVTSPPYFGLRDYGADGQIGLESSPEAYIARLVDVFREVRRVLREDGTLWVNMGDSYAGSAQGRGTKEPTPKQASNQGTAWMNGRDLPRLPEGCKPKDLIGIPWLLAFALRADGWYLRQDIIWAKPNPMPESVTDRCTKSHEYIFLLSKSRKYYYDAAAVAEPSTAISIARAGRADLRQKEGWAEAYHGNPPKGMKRQRPTWEERKANGEPMRMGLDPVAVVGPSHFGDAETRNKHSVWSVNTHALKEAHFATFPPKLIEPCILAGCPEGGLILDPFTGAGTTGLVALRHGRNFVGIELNPEYAAMAERRITNDAPLFNVRVA